eukprot:gb/GECH01007979.1/.p1 GENE.gb/GECH01007979.1/~~gb/GECH01007979.1/.p1  ORF type:complete len:279 (+),score=65.64 gb/GECH01007979.1/:1-837(+)
MGSSKSKIFNNSKPSLNFNVLQLLFENQDLFIQVLSFLTFQDIIHLRLSHSFFLQEGKLNAEHYNLWTTLLYIQFQKTPEQLLKRSQERISEREAFQCYMAQHRIFCSYFGNYGGAWGPNCGGRWQFQPVQDGFLSKSYVMVKDIWWFDTSNKIGRVPPLFEYVIYLRLKRPRVSDWIDFNVIAGKECLVSERIFAAKRNSESKKWHVIKTPPFKVSQESDLVVNLKNTENRLHSNVILDYVAIQPSSLSSEFEEKHHLKCIGEMGLLQDFVDQLEKA